MRCPVCNIPMIVVEYERIELDYCTNCRGVWFDSGELELLLQKANLGNPTLSMSQVLESPETESHEKRRRCPVCRSKMKKSALGERPGVLVDICPRGEGIWFDGGEIAQLVTRLSAQTGAKSGSPEGILGFLGKVFEGRE